MFEATTGVATGERLDEHHPEALAPECRRDEQLGGGELAVAHLVRDDPEHVDPVLVEAKPGVEQPVLERIGADQPQPRARSPPDLGPGSQQHGQPLARVVAAR